MPQFLQSKDKIPYLLAGSFPPLLLEAAHLWPQGVPKAGVIPSYCLTAGHSKSRLFPLIPPPVCFSYDWHLQRFLQ